MIQFHVPPENQGQIVEVSYALAGDYTIRCMYDQSDRTKLYALTRTNDDDDGDYWNGAPHYQDWELLTEEDAQRLLDEEAY